jgi:hypothetical protein
MFREEEEERPAREIPFEIDTELHKHFSEKS